MDRISINYVAFCFIYAGVLGKLPALQYCHYHPDPPPPDDILPPNSFSWMAVLEYLHIEYGTRYDSALPRVSIIHPSFGITTATAAAGVPEGYALGNVVIVEYVRDEATCGLSMEEAMDGAECPRASYVVPIQDVILHPEFSSFGAPESLALLKLMRPVESTYLMPVCLPVGGAWTYDKKVEKVFLLDFLSVAPEDYETERKGIKRLHILHKMHCDAFQQTLNTSAPWRERVLCTTGCGARAGSPLVGHDDRLRMGHYWHLVGVAVGGPPCSEPAARNRRNAEPPRFVYVWPYVEWIEQVVMSHEIPFPLAVDALRQNTPTRRRYNGWYTRRWEGRWYIEGTWCHYDYRMLQIHYDKFVFYEDYLSVRTVKRSWLRYFLNLRNDPNWYIRCIKMLMPNQFLTPSIFLDPKRGYNSTVTMSLVRFPRRYDLRIQAWANQSPWPAVAKWRKELESQKQAQG